MDEEPHKNHSSAKLLKIHIVGVWFADFPTLDPDFIDSLDPDPDPRSFNPDLDHQYTPAWLCTFSFRDFSIWMSLFSVIEMYFSDKFLILPLCTRVVLVDLWLNKWTVWSYDVWMIKYLRRKRVTSLYKEYPTNNIW